MSALLVFHDGQSTRRVACKELTTIGRDPACEVVLDDLKVSRRHAMVYRLSEHNYYIVDEGSANGTYINAQRISLPTRLNDGDQLTIGGLQVAFQLAPASADEPRPAGTNATTVVIAPTVEVVRIAILVADIRGFTTLSESLPVKTLTEIMNRWFHAAAHCVKQHGGTIDKFLGDSVYARWDAGTDVPGAIRHAIEAAVELNAVSREIREQHPEMPHPIQIGVGINFGIAALGTDQGRTAIGDAVNLAFRLEEQSKILGKDIVISKDAYEQLPELICDGREQSVVADGKKEPVTVCAFSFDEIAAMLKRHP